MNAHFNAIDLPELPALPGRSAALSRAIDKVLAHADCQSAIQPIDNRRYGVAQTGSLLYRRLLTGLRLRNDLREPC